MSSGAHVKAYNDMQVTSPLCLPRGDFGFRRGTVQRRKAHSSEFTVFPGHAVRPAQVTLAAAALQSYPAESVGNTRRAWLPFRAWQLTDVSC